MRCPFCHKDNDKVVDSRASGAAIRRRRECLACRPCDLRAHARAVRERRECVACTRRYTTYERAEIGPARVVKKDGSREAFDRSKIRQGLLLALHKRPVPTSRLDEMLQEIETELNDRGDLEIPSRAIGDLVMRKLAKEDQVAYVRFASVYKNFQSPSEFAQEVKPMLARHGEAGGAAGPGPGPAPSGKKPRAGAGG